MHSPVVSDVSQNAINVACLHLVQAAPCQDVLDHRVLIDQPLQSLGISRLRPCVGVLDALELQRLEQLLPDLARAGRVKHAALGISRVIAIGLEPLINP